MSDAKAKAEARRAKILGRENARLKETLLGIKDEKVCLDMFCIVHFRNTLRFLLYNP
jgi:hypothetical protein